MRKVVLASNNEGKVAELSEMIRLFNQAQIQKSAAHLISLKDSKSESHSQIQHSLQIALVSQAQLNISEIEETGLSFVENAILKARHASKLSGYHAIADDSGLEVDYLGGAPGIYSARYSEEKTDIANNLKLVNALQGVQESMRTARFKCVLVYLDHWQDPSPVIAEGSLEGLILAKPQGAEGFGYDPLFYVPEHHKTLAQMPFSLKNGISHRFQAMNRLMNTLAVGG